ncbi:MAG: hypothetical protein QG635_2227 [Bacteroidota bacterium]|nr:hypothetical protein [Bacteroidota bacterium]
MKKLLLIMLAILTFSCKEDEKVVDNTKDEWLLLAAADDGALKLVQIPEGKILSEDIYKQVNGVSLEAPARKIAFFRNTIYLLMPDVFKIEVIDSRDYKHIATIDFSAEQLIPSDICFPPNATSAYICHGNDSIVSIVDIKNGFVISRKIQCGMNPVSIACSQDTILGNQIITANKGDNTSTVIDTRDNKAAATLKIGIAPLFAKTTPDGKRFIVICAGAGKVDSLTGKSAAEAYLIDIESRGIIAKKDVGFGIVNAIDQIPQGVAITLKNWAFIPTDKALLKYETRFGQQIAVVSQLPHKYALYNIYRDQLLLLRNDGAGSIISVANNSTGKEEQSIKLPIKIIAIQPL